MIRSEETIAIEFERRLRDVAVEHPDAEAFLVQINPRVSTQFTGHSSRVLHALEARDRQVVPVRGLRRARARPLRDHLHGHARGGRGARAAVPPGRRGAGRDRRAAHVRRRRRGRENRRLHHLDRRRRAATSARSGWCASTRSGAPRRARCCSTSPARSSARRARAAGTRASGRAQAPLAAPRARRAGAAAPGEPRRAPAPRPADSEDAEARREAGLSESPDGDRLRARGGARGRGAPRDADGRAEGDGRPRMAYNPSLGVVAAGAGGAVRLPRPRRAPSSSGDRRLDGAVPQAQRIENHNDMYAIVKTGGKQYRVERGQTLLVERLPAAEGATSRSSRCSTAPRRPCSTRPASPT